jgi:alkanesulfonate monooxygenase SsuD/methylene tetrahydromethanopterin reductase-like flavin-dependent oxidoreductase (luciferase family)
MTTIGVVFMASHPPERLKTVARAADEAGLEELWLWEDCFRYSGIASAAAALASTDRLRVAAGLLPVPLRNVALTAMELATLHRMFPGRVLSGVGHGVQEWMAQVGVRVESPLTLLQEHVTALTRLLRGDTVTMSGRYVRLDAVALQWPPSPPAPIFVGAIGERTVRLSGEVADGTMLVAGTPPERVRQIRRALPAGRLLSVNVDAGSRPGDAEALAGVIRQYGEAGADRVILEPAPDDPDPEGFVRFVATHVQPLVRASDNPPRTPAHRS